MVSLAARIEPELLRAARLHGIKGTDAAAEGDLWFSSLVLSRNALFAVMKPEVANELRGRLANDPAALARAWAVLHAAHRNAPPAMRVEEEITWRTLADPDDPEIERLFESLLAGLHARRPGLARWTARALPRMPASAQELGAAWRVALKASQLLGGHPILTGGPSRAPLRELASELGGAAASSVPVGLRLFDDALRISHPPELHAQTIEIPKTDPLVLEVAWSDERRLVSFGLDSSHTLRPIGPGTLRIGTAGPEEYVVTPTERWQNVSAHTVVSVEDDTTLRLYRGDDAVLLAFDVENSRTKELAGFAVSRLGPDGNMAWIEARSAQGARLGPSNLHPLQRFRHIDQTRPGRYTYQLWRVHGAHERRLASPPVSAHIDVEPPRNLQVGFTRPQGAPDDSGGGFENSASRIISDFLMGCRDDPTTTVVMRLRGIDDPDLIGVLAAIGPRLTLLVETSAALGRAASRLSEAGCVVVERRTTLGDETIAVQRVRVLDSSTGAPRNRVNAAVLTRLMQELHWSREALQHQSGLAPKTIRRLLATPDALVTPEVLVALASAFNAGRPQAKPIVWTDLIHDAPQAVLTTSADFTAASLHDQHHYAIVVTQPDIARFYDGALQTETPEQISARFYASEVPSPVSGVSFLPDLLMGEVTGARAKSSILFCLTGPAHEGLLEQLKNPDSPVEQFIGGVFHGPERGNIVWGPSVTKSHAVTVATDHKPDRRGDYIVIDFNTPEAAVLVGSFGERSRPPCSTSETSMKWGSGLLSSHRHLGSIPAQLVARLDQAIEVRGRGYSLETALLGVVTFELHFGMGSGQCLTHRSGVSQDVALVELQEAVELRDPVGHRHRPALARLLLGVVEIHHHDALERAQLLSGQIVLGDGDVGLPDRSARSILPAGETHVWLTCVRSCADDLCGGLAVDRPVHLVLDGRVERLRQLCRRIVVDAALGVDIRDLLVEPALRRADPADPFEELVEVVRAEVDGRLEALVVHDEALDQVLVQPCRGPLPEPCSLLGPNAIADRDDRRQVVVVDHAHDLART